MKKVACWPCCVFGICFGVSVFGHGCGSTTVSVWFDDMHPCQAAPVYLGSPVSPGTPDLPKGMRAPVTPPVGPRSKGMRVPVKPPGGPGSPISPGTPDLPEGMRVPATPPGGPGSPISPGMQDLPDAGGMIIPATPFPWYPGMPGMPVPRTPPRHLTGLLAKYEATVDEKASWFAIVYLFCLTSCCVTVRLLASGRTGSWLLGPSWLIAASTKGQCTKPAFVCRIGF